MDESLRELERQFSQTPNEALRRQVATAYRRQGRLFDAWKLIRSFKDWPERPDLSVAMWQEQIDWLGAQPAAKNKLVQWVPSVMSALSEGRRSPVNSVLKHSERGHICELTLNPLSQSVNKQALPEFGAEFPFITGLRGGHQLERRDSPEKLTHWLSGFKALESFQSLSNLHWWGLLPTWPHLTKLTARFLHLNSHEELQRFPQLKSIEAGTFTLLNSTELFNELPGIKHFDIRRIIRPEQYLLFSLLPKLKSLESLTFGFSLHNDELETLGQFKKLKQLSLRFETLSSERLQMLSPLKNLESLTLSRCDISNEALERLLQFPKLRSLSLKETEYENQALNKLAGLTALENLELSKTKLDSQGLSALKQWPKLKRLWIQNCPRLRRNSTEFISDIPQLEAIDFNQSDIDKLRLEEVRPDVTVLDPIENSFNHYASVDIH